MPEDKNKEKIHPDKFKKTVNIQHDGRQYSIRIPALIIREMGIEKGDKFTFELHFGENRKDNKLYCRFGD